MRHRKLRIAWSVGCSILCMLLIALWVFGYWQTSAPMLLHVCVGPERYFYVHLFPNGIGAAIFQFQSNSTPEVTSVVGAPFWLLVPLTAAISFTP